MLDFVLAWMFFRAIKIIVHRSAISSVLPQVNGFSVGYGDINKKSPRPKYGFCYDINVVLKHLLDLPNDTNFLFYS